MTKKLWKKPNTTNIASSVWLSMLIKFKLSCFYHLLWYAVVVADNTALAKKKSLKMFAYSFAVFFKLCIYQLFLYRPNVSHSIPEWHTFTVKLFAILNGLGPFLGCYSWLNLPCNSITTKSTKKSFSLCVLKTNEISFTQKYLKTT
jgi:hypothetical protein